MWSVHKFLFFCSCLVTIKYGEIGSVSISDLNKKIQFQTLLIDIFNERVVTFGQFEYNVFLYNPYSLDEFEGSRVSHLYTCINCEFAAWTQHQLYAFLKPFPLIFHSSFQDVFNNVFGLLNQKMIDQINIILKYVERFIQILFELLDAFTYASLVDTTLLKSLLSLSMKINFMKTTLSNCKVDENGNFYQGYDDVIVRIIVEEINAIQSFRALNCKFSEVYYDKNPFYGYWISHKFNYYKENHMDVFFVTINSDVIESDQTQRCNLKDMLLGNIMMHPEHILTRELGHAKWNTEFGPVYVKDVFKRIIEQSYELEVIFWYQELMIKTIMKLLGTKLINEKPKFDADIHLRLKKLADFFTLQKFPNLSTEIIDFFSLLATETEIQKQYFQDAIQNHLESLEEIELVTNADPNSKIIDEQIAMNQLPNGLLMFDENSEDWTVKDNTNQYSLPLSTFKSLLNALTEPDDAPDFKCFVQLFEFLNFEYNKHYIPFLRNPKKINLFVEGIIVNPYDGSGNVGTFDRFITSKSTKPDFKIKEGCKFLKGLFHYWFKIIIALNKSREIYTKIINKTYFNEAKQMLIYIMDKLIDVNNGNEDDPSLIHPIFKTATYIVALLETNGERLFRDSNIAEIRRLLNVIMTGFNEYALAYCNTPEYNLLLFNNLNFNFKMDVVNKDIESSLVEIKKKRTGNISIRYFRLARFYNALVKAPINFSDKNQLIFFYWKGGHWTIQAIYTNITSIILHYSYLYAFYDICYKYAIAAIYCLLADLHKHMQNAFLAKQSSIQDKPDGKASSNISKLIKGRRGATSADDCKTFSELGMLILFDNNSFNSNYEGFVMMLTNYLTSIHAKFCLNELSLNGKTVVDISDQIKTRLETSGVLIYWPEDQTVELTESSDSGDADEPSYQNQQVPPVRNKSNLKLSSSQAKELVTGKAKRFFGVGSVPKKIYEKISKLLTFVTRITDGVQ
ncbi:Hypothetical protein CINCED_3A015185 [Cinara cedri]|uniref:Uncharacterized protein n=1 Tax=Cinara cedri TaxID=506608 RepID=A0A5E4MQ87_9HEMI|nr:Hypothetical protein CINCED_3A015185 [Cinara cedri]